MGDCMVNLSLICQLFFIILFLSTAFSKVTKFKEHASIFKSLVFLKKIPVHVLLIFLIFVEVSIPIGFIFNINYTLTLYAASVLLILYTLGIIVHLVNSKEKMNCGCGGILNSEELSTGIVIRNLFFVAILVLMATFPVQIKWSINLIPFIFSSILLANFYYLFSEYRLSMKKIDSLERGL
ncbi:MauE/DoxX family redox-associated membrane protein [Cytobacillus sp. IB215316]|uniref:MauE/DoxX family redox-associated membrane protein n=2 Tax=Bacillaceae TaxID=186817 RepID=UPI0039B72665